jgi:glutathione synthase
MRFVVIMDPPSTVLEDKDTSFALMLEMQRRGHRVDHCMQRDLYLDRGKLWATVRQATIQRGAVQPIANIQQRDPAPPIANIQQRDPAPPIALGAPEDVCLHEVDAVLERTDPPFDSDYWWCTLMLDRLSDDTLVVNAPRGLRSANEKLYACNFPELMPRTMVTGDKQKAKRFLAEVGGQGVIKPLGGAGGEGVFMLRADDMNLNAIIEHVTRNGTCMAMVQEFLPAVREGDKRILLLEGEPLGAILRVPQRDDVRSNIHVGGTVVKAEITAAERRMIDALAPRLREDGLFFVGLDVIGGKLTEVNVTSPTGIQQMSRLDGENYESRVIAWLEEHA